MTRNARFWTYINGWVKLTIAPGDTLTHREFHRHEEGWSSTQTEWSHLHDFIEEFQYSDGVDCDGRLSRVHTRTAALNQLDTGRYVEEAEGFIYRVPEWRKERASQRDYSAEAANY